MPEIKVVPLGAGQEVGRSCILVTIGGYNVMLDCGMHMGYSDERRFPDFSYITKQAKLEEFLDCVIISHFHLDHSGALPHMSEMVGYNGPIYMTYPTKAIVPVLLEDYRKVQVDYRGDSNFFTSQMIKDCMKKVIPVSLNEVVKVKNDLQIKAYYGGHVIGAAIFEVRVGSESIVYTGDYNMTPDRHLGAAQISRCTPDLLISESTYATTIRESKRARERDFLRKVHDCVRRGGKVLIPVFALGRAQELCILLESYWERLNLQVPVYFSPGLAEKANDYYKLFITWTNEKIKKTFVRRNMFEFRCIQPFDNTAADQPGPMVLFATPGMLHSGQSLKVFKKWAPDERNMVIMPGYCVQGTVGSKVISGAKKIEIEGGKTLEIKLGVQYMSFSAHADAKGILQLIKNCQPKHVMFVHGEESKMECIKLKVEKEFNIPVFKPANGETITVYTKTDLLADVSNGLLSYSKSLDMTPSKRMCPFRGTFIFTERESSMTVVSPEEALKRINRKRLILSFTCQVPLPESVEPTSVLDKVARIVTQRSSSLSYGIDLDDNTINFNDKVFVKAVPQKNILEVKWQFDDNEIGNTILHYLRAANLEV
ncbi:unnamed protein product [Soboliphyme baturini]|uniref:Integrator complex subunit 11 n=1 Tax=Soboliphyme baturini TaxID=241478 RepID=A0A183IEW0_9BILA|nr:unnamed protein product [Soboliphyme baturini]